MLLARRVTIGARRRRAAAGDGLTDGVGVVLGDLARSAGVTRYWGHRNSMPMLRPLKTSPSTASSTMAGDGVPEPLRPTKSIGLRPSRARCRASRLAHQALPPTVRASVEAVDADVSASRPESPWPWLKNLNRASHVTIGLVNQKNTTEVDQGREAEGEREAAAPRRCEEVEDHGREQRDGVGGEAGVPGPLPAGLDGDPHRLAVAHLVTDAFEVDDERVGGDTDRHDQARDAGQRQREAAAVPSSSTTP